MLKLIFTISIRLLIVTLILTSIVLIVVAPGSCSSSTWTKGTRIDTLTSCAEHSDLQHVLDMDLGSLYGQIRRTRYDYSFSYNKLYIQFVVFGVSVLLVVYVLLLASLALLTSSKSLQLICCQLLILCLSALGAFEMRIGFVYNISRGPGKTSTLIVKGWIAAAALYFVSMLLAIGDMMLMILYKPQTVTAHK